MGQAAAHVAGKSRTSTEPVLLPLASARTSSSEQPPRGEKLAPLLSGRCSSCLLYTSDAADDM
eukprot:14861960-Alexandrium_andersonii.AAC.1